MSFRTTPCKAPSRFLGVQNICLHPQAFGWGSHRGLIYDLYDLYGSLWGGGGATAPPAPPLPPPLFRPTEGLVKLVKRPSGRQRTLSSLGQRGVISGQHLPGPFFTGREALRTTEGHIVPVRILSGRSRSIKPTSTLAPSPAISPSTAPWGGGVEGHPRLVAP